MRRAWASVLVLVVLASELRGHTSEEERRTRERALEQRNLEINGITIGTPKVYDDSVLQQMLNAAQARLAALQVIDQASVSAKLGGLTGASQQISSTAFSVQTPSIPGSTVTDNSGTQSTSTGGPNAGTTTTVPVHNVVTTVPAFAPPSITAPPSSTTLPTTVAVSASDLLNEQMQLTYEIANLRLLLEGSLSDRVVFNAQAQSNVVRHRMTLGFPIAVAPDKRHKNAAAIVEVEIETNKDSDLSENGEPPAVLALLPREKTYNVAKIMDRSTSIGLGVVTQVVGLSGSFLRGTKTFYVVQDQDTVALTLPPRGKVEPRTTALLWQFRPVLGESFVKSGLKQTFIQLAFPSVDDRTMGRVRIRTYWRKYDQKRGILKDIVQGSLNDTYPEYPVGAFDMKQKPSAFGVADIEDLGNGQALVRVPGKLMTGTYLRLGTAYLQPGTPGFTSEYNVTRFVASFNDLATKRTFVVSRDGTEVPLQINDSRFGGNARPRFVSYPDVTALDETNSRVRLETESIDPLLFPIVLVIGGKVFGQADAPITRIVDGSRTKISAIVPTATLVASRTIGIKPMLVDHQYVDFKSIIPDEEAQGERLSLVAQGDPLTYVVYGRRLSGLTVLVPASVSLKPFGGYDSDTMRLLTLTADQAKNTKQLVLQRGNERPFVIAVPTPPSSDTAAKQPAKFTERVTVGTDEAVITGDGLKDVVKVTIQKRALTTFEVDGKTVTLRGLVLFGATSVARTVSVELETKSGEKIKVPLEVVTNKVELIESK